MGVAPPLWGRSGPSDEFNRTAGTIIDAGGWWKCSLTDRHSSRALIANNRDTGFPDAALVENTYGGRPCAPTNIVLEMNREVRGRRGRLSMHIFRAKSDTEKTDGDCQLLWTVLAWTSIVASLYFFGARFGLGLRTEEGGVAVFWPASGIALGILLARGRSVWLPGAMGVIVATVTANVLDDRNFFTAFGKGLCNAGEAVLAAWLVERWFSRPFKLDNVTRIVGFVSAACVSTALAAVGGAITMRSFHAVAPLSDMWKAWFLSDFVGIIAVAPFVVGLLQIVYDRAPRRELIKGGAVLLILGVWVMFVFALPADTWPSLVPLTIVLPVLLLIASRFKPAFSGIAAFMVAIAIIWSTIAGIGSFGDANVPLDRRVFSAQAAVLIVTLSSLVLAALFDEGRQAERTLRRSNSHLQESNQRLQLAIGAARLGTFGIDIDKGSLECDLRAGQMHGFDEEKPANVRDGSRFIDPNDWRKLRAAYAQARQSGCALSAKYRVLLPNGHTRWIALDASIVRDVKCTPSRLIGVTRDITAEKVSERKLHDQIGAEHQVLARISEGAHISEVLEDLIRTAEAQSDSGMIASILFIDKEGRRLLHGAAPNLPQTYNNAIHGLAIGPHVGSCGRAAYLGEPVFVADISSHPFWVNYRELALAHGLRACSSTPIKAMDKRVLGTFAIYYRETRLPSPTDLEAIALITHTAALAIERHTSEQIVRESQERLQLALDGAQLGVWSVDLHTGAFENDFRDRTHHGHDQKAPPRTLEEARNFVEQDDLPVVDAAFIKARIGGRCSVEYRIRNAPRDRPVWLAVEGSVLHDRMGVPARLLGVTRNITKYKFAEQSLRNQEQAFRRLLGAVPVAIYTTDVNGRITYCNKCAVNMWGRNPEVGQDKWHDMAKFYFADGKPMPLDMCPTAIALSSGHAVHGREAVLERHDRSRLPVMPCPTPLRDEAGAVVGSVTTMIDLTGLKEAEWALSERSAQLDLAERATHVGSFSTDVGSETFRCSPGFAALVDIPVNGKEAATAAWQARVHPEDLPRLDAGHKRAFAERKTEHTVEYRIVRSNGEIRWIEARNVTSYNSSGQPISMLGVNIDITERKDAERHKSMLIAELDHRVKNALACVAAIAHHSRSSSRSVEGFFRDFNSRINSLVNSHTLLSRSRWKGASLHELIFCELAPWRSRGNILLNGPDAWLSAQAVQPVAMVLNELATNAAKYGALSDAKGMVTVSSFWGGPRNQTRLVIEWQEAGGPDIHLPITDGYGATVIRDLIPYELGGKVCYTFAPDGLHCRLEIPIQWISKEGGLSGPVFRSIPVGTGSQCKLRD